MQEFNLDTLEVKAAQVYKDTLAGVLQDLADFYKSAYMSSELGVAIFKARKTTIYESLSIERFKKAYWRIIEAQKAIGSIDSYLNLYYAVFGETANILVAKSKKHLRFDITAKEFEYSNWTALNGDQFTEKKSGALLYFKAVKLPISKKDLLSLLRKSSVHGTYIEIHLNGD